jgi:hypothetical protein
MFMHYGRKTTLSLKAPDGTMRGARGAQIPGRGPAVPSGLFYSQLTTLEGGGFITELGDAGGPAQPASLITHPRT